MPTTPIHHDVQHGRPLALEHVTGQTRAVRQLKTALEAHFNDRAANSEQPAFPHVLLVGPSGVGKSLLAQILASELRGKLHEELAQNIGSPSILHGLLMLPEEGDCLFVDEVHELPTVAQTTLYRCLEERKLFLPGSKRQERQSLTLPPFTFIAATTDEWALTKPLRDRFKIVLRLEHYSEDDLAQVVAQRATRLGWSMTDAAAKFIGARGRGTPRVGLRLLEAARRTTRAAGAETITIDHLRIAFEVEGLDKLGLDPVEQRYLKMLGEAQGPLRLNVLATRLGLPRQTIEQVVESDLIRLGLLTKDEGSQRLLTAEGRRHTSGSS